MDVPGHHKFYKILRAGLNHQGVQYAYDISMCVVSGVYFCPLLSIPRWLDLYEDNEFVAEIHFLPQSHIKRLGPHKLCTDWFILRNPVPIPKFVKRYFEPMDLLSRSPFLIRYMEAPSLTLQFYAIEENPRALACIKAPNPDVCALAVAKNGLCIQYAPYPTIDLYRVAVAQNGLALALVREQFWNESLYEKEMREICLTAVTQNGFALQFVRTQTEEICLAAVAQNGYALEIVRPEMRTPGVCRIAWKENWRALEFATGAFNRAVERRREFHLQ